MRILADWGAKGATVWIVDRMVMGVKVDQEAGGVVFQESSGHGFSRAVPGEDPKGFQPLRPQRLKPGLRDSVTARLKACPDEMRDFAVALRRGNPLRVFR